MASETDVVNLALSHLGDLANVQSITPPDGSIQAELAARFFPHVRDTLLEMHTWGFATTCSALASLTNTSTRWGYAYAKPNDMIRMIGSSEIGFGFDQLYRETVRDEILASGRPAWMDIINTGFAIEGDRIDLEIGSWAAEDSPSAGCRIGTVRMLALQVRCRTGFG